MTMYRCPEGVSYNLDRFVSFKVKSSGYHQTGTAGPLSQLVAQTETLAEVTIYTDESIESEKKCNAELNKILHLLKQGVPVSVVLDNDTKADLREISSTLKKLYDLVELMKNIGR